MTTPNFGENLNSTDNLENSDSDANSSMENSDQYSDKGAEDTALLHEAPMDDHVAPVNHTDETNIHDAPVAEKVTAEAPIGANAASPEHLLNREESEHLRTRWIEIQGEFVDDPRSAVQQADALVSEVVEKITQMFASEHTSLEGQWNQGIDVSTEDLRKALQHYRSFFNRLVV